MPEAKGLSTEKLWQARQLRLTAFTTEFVEEMLLDDSWQRLLGEEPEVQVVRKREKQLNIEGPYEHGTLLYTISFPAINWQYMRPANDDLTITLGGFPDVVVNFKNLMKRWLTEFEIPPINRLAFGAELVIPVDTREQAYRILSDALPFDLDPNKASDFMYQINRRRQSHLIPDLGLNRLTRWSAERLASGAIRVIGDAVERVAGPEYYYAKLTLDINTSPEYKDILPHNKLSELFDDLVSLGVEISEKGDIS